LRCSRSKHQRQRAGALRPSCISVGKHGRPAASQATSSQLRSGSRLRWRRAQLRQNECWKLCLKGAGPRVRHVLAFVKRSWIFRQRRTWSSQGTSQASPASSAEI
jgi:hypothetical protein